MERTTAEDTIRSLTFLFLNVTMREKYELVSRLFGTPYQFIPSQNCTAYMYVYVCINNAVKSKWENFPESINTDDDRLFKINRFSRLEENTIRDGMARFIDNNVSLLIWGIDFFEAATTLEINSNFSTRNLSLRHRRLSARKLWVSASRPPMGWTILLPAHFSFISQ